MSNEKTPMEALFFFPIIPEEFHAIEFWVPITKKMIPYVRDGYYVSSFGRILSTIKPGSHLMVPKTNRGGYVVLDLAMEEYCPLSRPRKTVRVSRLVMLGFNYRDDHESLQVNHIDGNKFNNNVWNLEWCTAQENINHAYKIGLKGPGKDEEW